jgi:hypothetical protein
MVNGFSLRNEAVIHITISQAWLLLSPSAPGELPRALAAGPLGKFRETVGKPAGASDEGSLR